MAENRAAQGRLSDKVVLLTGAAGGIGRAITQRLTAEGALLVLADLDGAAVDTLAKHHGALGLTLDVSSETQWLAAMSAIERHHGRLDALVNNAGINRSRGGETPEDFVLQDLRDMMTINAEGVALGCRNALPLLKRAGGAIVNMSSIAGLLPADFIAAYGASKAFVTHWTKSVALHCARHGYRIRCNSVHPGSVLTPMMSDLFERMAATAGGTAAEAEQSLRERIPLGDYQSPLDIANAVLFLLSDEARQITGIELVVDGGMMLAL